MEPINIWKEGDDPSPVISGSFVEAAKHIESTQKKTRDFLQLIAIQSDSNSVAIKRDPVIFQYAVHATGTNEERLARLVYLLWLEKTELVTFISKLSNEQGYKLTYRGGKWMWIEEKEVTPESVVVRIAE